MMIGILSDTHGDVKRTHHAIEGMKRHCPVHIIHCGDIGSQAVLTELAAGFMEPEIPVTCVYGNVDLYGERLFSSWPHVKMAGRFAELELGGKKIAVAHGDDAGKLQDAVDSGRYDYIFTGHTHVRSDEHIGRTRILNPGAIHRSRSPGCVCLNVATGALYLIHLNAPTISHDT